MRLRPLTLFVCFASFVVSLASAEVSFVRVWPGWVDAEAFETISEYFTGREESGKRIVHRTQPDARAGFYFLVRVANTDTAPTGSKFSLHVVFPGNPEAKIYTFPAELRERSTVFQLGLTGDDWPDRDMHPVAWKIDLLSADDQVLATSQSFLWSKPAK
jgi:hypothetical protein